METSAGDSGRGFMYSFSIIFSLINVNSLMNKLSELNMFVVFNNVDILGVTETWLTSDVPDSFVALPGYQIVRADVPGTVKKHGSALYIKFKYKFMQISCAINNVVVVYLIDFNIYIVNVYRPPSNSAEDNDALVNFLIEFCFDKEVILQGDFNLPSLRWDEENLLDFYVTPLDRMFYNTFSSLGLSQVVRESTNYPSGNVIDLVHLSNEERLGSCSVLAPLSRCSHGSVVYTYLFQTDLCRDDASYAIRIWSKSRFDVMKRHIDEIDWHLEFLYLDPDQQFARFIELLSPLIEKFVPIRNVKYFNKPP